MRPETKRQLRRLRSLKGPIILFVITLVLVVALLVLWNVVLAYDYQRIRELAEQAAAQEGRSSVFHGTFIVLGSVLFVTAITLFSLLGASLFSEIRYTQRLSSFVATVTHELNSPLASIKLFAQTLRRGVKDEERERFCELILSDVERLRGLISNVLRAAEVDSPHGVQLAASETELRAYLAEWLEGRRAALERADRPPRLALLPGPTARVELDRLLFRQVLDNLLDNAIKYCDAPEARIELWIGRGADPEQPVALEVRDNGVGLRERDLERIFDQFGRVEADGEASGPRRAGTGLGLFIVRAIVAAHGGTVKARSGGLGQGTTLRIELPGAVEGEPEAVVAAGRGGEA